MCSKTSVLGPQSFSSETINEKIGLLKILELSNYESFKTFKTKSKCKNFSHKLF